MVESHNNEPEIVEPPVGSLTNNPPFAMPVPFSSIILSPIWTVVESIWVVVPFTVKLPLIVKFAPLAVIAVFNEDVYEFNSVSISITCEEPETTLIPLKNEPLWIVVPSNTCDEPETTPVGNNDGIWDEPLTTPFGNNRVTCDEPDITPSVFNLSLTFESKLVIESASTWDEPLNIPDGIELMFAYVIWDEPLTIPVPPNIWDEPETTPFVAAIAPDIFVA